MASRPTRRNKRQSDFRIVARGIHRPKPDIPRLTKASLDHYLAAKEAQGDAVEIKERSDDAA